MTVHEAKLLQTFPDDYAITGSWGEAMRQIGNAVPVLLAEKMGRQLVMSLSRNSDTIVEPECGFINARAKQPIQLRLAIEGRKKYVAKNKVNSKKGKNAAKAKRPKSIKARYAKHG